MLGRHVAKKAHYVPTFMVAMKTSDELSGKTTAKRDQIIYVHSHELNLLTLATQRCTTEQDTHTICPSYSIFPLPYLPSSIQAKKRYS